MRFRIDSPAIPARKFVLPADELATAPASLPELGKPVKPHVWGAGSDRQTYKRPVQAQAPRRTPEQRVHAQTGARGLFKVSAPVQPRKGRTVLDFVAATDAEMDSFLGTIRLDISPEAVDLSRLESGVMALAVDHDVTRLMGRITEATIHPGRLDMEAEISTTPTATSAMAEIDDLTRAGFSPGFLIHKVRILDEDDESYDPDQYMQIVCEKWEPYEISSTAIPRNRDARLKGVASMGDVIMDARELVSTSDLVGMSLAAGREILASGQGSAAQRSKLQAFFKLFDAGLENGLSRDVAATAARAESGI